MTNFERIKGMTLDELDQFLQDAEDSPPWVKAFADAYCATCKTETVMLEGCTRPVTLYECDYIPRNCLHGNSIRWRLEQEADEDA